MHQLRLYAFNSSRNRLKGEFSRMGRFDSTATAGTRGVGLDPLGDRAGLVTHFQNGTLHYLRHLV